ncbi:hypothetical protein tinsulaeT_02630 [Thalassotalea insulae]|uniref:KfrA N-terminal DNA-binding domain-containing protein n=1 Tax=Thalassotalea insulae TaxID=2056778 RepID=A0ABQ6GLM2_9GAMM|nr:hypothetical protein [Thalassotalea insulae]GLX76923.1 hypothetical protein tinsulaeT_02630 [Thalassotalea insulae]
MAQPLKSLTYEDVELFCEQTLKTGTSVTLESVLEKFPNDSIDVAAYFHQWHQRKLNQSLASPAQNSDNNSDSKSEIPPSISQIMQEEIAKQQASQAGEQQTLLAKQQDIEQILLAKSQELQANLDSQSKFVDETHQQLKQQSQEFQEKFQQLTSGYNDEVNSLKQHHQQSLIAQQQAHRIAIESIINENETQLDNLTEQVTQLTETNTLLKAKAEQYLASQQQLSVLQTTISQLEQQLAEEKTKQEQHIAAAKNQYRESLNALRDAQQQEISELNTCHRNELATFSSQNVQQFDETNEQLSEIQQENKILAQQLAEEQSKSANLQSRLVNVSNDIANDKATQTKLLASLEQANAKVITLEQQLSQQETGLTVESDLNALEKAERMIAALSGENNKLATRLEHIKTNSVATIERLTDKSGQAIARIKELESQLELEIRTNSSAKEERITLKEQLELMKHNQASTFERLTNNLEQAKAKIKVLEEQLAEIKR